MIIDHICFAVRNLSKSIQLWEELFGYKQYTNQVINTRQKVKVVFLRREYSLMIKLIEPLKDNSSLIKFVSNGGGFHHICFKCENMNDTIKKLSTKRVKMLVPPQPGEAFENNNIAFLWLPTEIIKFELIDTEIKAEII